MTMNTTISRGQVRGDSVEMHVKRGDVERTFAIDGKAAVEDRRHRLYGFERDFTGQSIARKVEAAGNLLFLTPRGDGVRVDAASGIALARELEYVSAVIAQEPLSDLTATAAFPMAVDQPQAYQEFYAWKQLTWTKGGRLSRNYRDIGTRGDVKVEKNSQAVAPLLTHASWGLDEIAKAALGNIPLPAADLKGAMRTIGEALNTEVWFGDANEGIEGLYDNASIVKAAVALNGAGVSREWANKTPDEIEADLVEWAGAMETQIAGLGMLAPNRLALSNASYRKLAITRRSQFGGETLLQFAQTVMDSFSTNALITTHPELSNNGSGVKWGVMYRYDSQIAGRILPVPPTFLPPDIESTLITQAIHSQGGGLNVRYPLAFLVRTSM